MRGKGVPSVTFESRPISQGIGARLKELRIERELTQCEVGDRLGVSFQQIQKYELGTNDMSIPRLIHFCRALGIEPQVVIDSVWLLEAPDKHSEDNPLIAVPLDV